MLSKNIEIMNHPKKIYTNDKENSNYEDKLVMFPPAPPELINKISTNCIKDNLAPANENGNNKLFFA